MTDKFRIGNIYRIYMKNFLTYDAVEIFPKPHLNVIIGPNGTGKSSILCGICIGLGGKPEVTGRGRSLIEYIKQGRENSIIEIELFNPDGENYIVRRMFDRVGKSSKWFLNNDEAREKDVSLIISNLGIHVNNLCQFLPQDRVVEFAKMNKIQLLSSTEKAVGEMQLFEQHETLAKFGKTIQEMSTHLKDVQTQLANEIKKNNQLEDHVNNIKIKENLDKEIKKLNILIIFFKYNNSRSQTVHYSNKIRALKGELDEIDKRMQPTLKEISEIDKDLNDQIVLLRKKNGESNILKNKALSLANICDNEEERIKIAREQYKTLENNNRRRMEEISNLNKQLDGFQNQLSGVLEVDETELNNQIDNLTHEITQQSQQLMTVKNDIGVVNIELNALYLEHQTQEKQISDLRDTKSRRLQILQSRNRHAFNMTQWLKDKGHLFTGTVYEPMFALIDCRSEAYSQYLENVVSNRDLVAFTCENANDVETLKLEADKHKWSINILHTPPVDPATYVSKYPIDQLRKLGFECYVKDTIKGPGPIISYLCRNYNIHNIPIAKRADFEKVPKDINLFFIGNERFSNRKSRYDGGWSTNISALNRTQLLTHSIDTKDEEILIRNLNELKERFDQVKARKLNLQTEEQRIDHGLEILRTNKRDKMASKDQRKQLEARIRDKQEQISRRERNIIDLPSAEATMHTEIKNAVTELTSSCDKLLNIETEVTRESQRILDQSFKGSELNLKKRKKLKLLENDEKVKAEKLEAKQVVEREKQELENSCKRLLGELCQSFGVGSHRNIPQEDLRSLKNKANEGSLEDFESQIATKNARRELLVTGDDGILDEYKKRKEKIDELEEQQKKIQLSMESERTDVEACRLAWLPRIEELISNINEHFSRFMANLGCAGEVQLDKGIDENDFSQYGLAVKVKFRDIEKLKELTVHQQSGGERSVSTALYLMALQTLTAVPFRCVDEINQGMDPTNERKMFTMLVESTTNPTASQYFLITPKLLPNLPFNKRVTFLNILNWNTNTKVRHLNTEKILSNYKKKKERQSRR